MLTIKRVEIDEIWGEKKKEGSVYFLYFAVRT
jgi:hypothetical protein